MRRTLTIVAIVAVLAVAVAWRIVVRGRVEPAPGIEEVQARDGIPVDVATVREGTVTAVRSVSGVVRGLLQTTLVAPIDHRVDAVLVREGDRVRRGQVLLRFDVDTAPDLSTRIRQAEEALAGAERDLNRMEALTGQGAIADAELDRARTAVAIARANREDARRFTDLTSPIDGTVTWLAVTPGTSVEAGNQVVQVASVDSVLVIAEVSAQAASELRPGARVRLVDPEERATATYSETESGADRLEGRIVTVSLGADPLSRLYEVKAIFENRDLRLRPGQFVTLLAVTAETSEVVVAPRTALLTDRALASGTTVPVYVVHSGTSALRSVRLGAVGEDDVEIADGLDPGDRVVVFGANRLHDGAKIQLHSIDGRSGGEAS